MSSQEKRIEDPGKIISIQNLYKRYARNEHRPSLRHEAKEIWAQLFGKETAPHVEDPFYALQDVTLDIHRGETVGIVGLNGSGKTTLLRLIAGITQPTSGTINVNGNLVSLIGLGAGFIHTLSGRKNIYLNAAMHGVNTDEIERLMDPIIEFSELGEFIDLPTIRYSSGMLARLAFSIAIHILPELVLVDEVLAVGDAAFQQKCMERITEVFNGSRTFILVSHSSATIHQLCNRAIWLHQGSIVQDGPIDTVLPAYLEFISEIQKQHHDKSTIEPPPV
jgi:ABC-type polysaccharide/polyol phosphate transport system ATPase subunit